MHLTAFARSLFRPLLAAALALAASAAAPAAEPIVIGQVAPLSGPQAVTGRAIHAGAKLYFDAVNARGGVRGRPIRLVVRDDAQKPEQTVKLTHELIAAVAPLAMIGTVGTANLEALAKDGVLVAQRTAMVGAVSGATSVVRATGMHIVKASYHDEVARLFQQLANLGVKRVGLVYQDDGLGRDVLAGAEEAAQRHGIDLAARSGYARNTIAVEKAVDDMVAAKVQVVFLGATTAAGIEFVKRYAAAGGTGMLYGMSIIDTDVLLKALGPERSRGYAFTVVLPLVQQGSVAVVREYVQLRQSAPDPDLSARSIEGFIAAKALVKVLESLPSPTPASVSAALSAARAVDVGGYRLDFGDDQRPGSSHVDFAILGAGGRIVQ
jgi:ABC-type branched-subunit amino acid transport system substrate-binding protein